MAEFCLECWNIINGKNDRKWRYVLSASREFCEECQQYKRVIIVERFCSCIQRDIADIIRTNRKSR